MVKQKKGTKSIKAEEVIHSVNYWIGGVIAFICILLFVNTIGHDYALDDSGAIIENRFVQAGLSGIPDLLKVNFWHFSAIHLGYYRPLSLITFAIENEFFGANPHISHAFNVLLFASAGYVLFILLSKVFNRYNSIMVAIACLLFVSHPIHTEIVANIKGRGELLSFLNLLLMIWFMIRYADSKKVLHLLLSSMFCYLGMLSKETALIGIALVPLCIYYYKGSSIREAIYYSAAPFIVIVLFFVQKFYLLGTLQGVIPEDIVNYPYTDSSIKIPTTLYLFAFCIQLLIIPHPLRYDYSFNQIPAVTFSNPMAIIGFVLFAAGVYFAIKEIMKRSVMGFALAIFYITLIPSLAFTILRGGIFAERFLFFPALGFCLIVAYSFIVLLKVNTKSKHKVLIPWLKNNINLVLLITLIVSLYSFKTISRNAVWKNNLTLFEHDGKTGMNSAQNMRHLGNQYVYLASKENDPIKKANYAGKAINTLKRALNIHPKFGEGYYLIASVYQIVTPNNDSAIYYYNKAIKHAPGYAPSYYNIGVLYQGMGKLNVASYYYNQAIKYNPEYLEPKTAANNLKSQGIDVHINPLSSTVDFGASNKNSTYYYNLGNYHAANNDYKSAIVSFSKSIELDARNEGAYINLANCYGTLKQYDRCIKVLNQVLAINPSNRNAIKNMALTYKLSGNVERADEYYERLKNLN